MLHHSLSQVFFYLATYFHHASLMIALIIFFYLYSYSLFLYFLFTQVKIYYRLKISIFYDLFSKVVFPLQQLKKRREIVAAILTFLHTNVCILYEALPHPANAYLELAFENGATVNK